MKLTTVPPSESHEHHSLAARNQTLPEYILVLKSDMVFNLDGDGYMRRTVLIMDRVHNIGVWKIIMKKKCSSMTTDNKGVAADCAK